MIALINVYKNLCRARTPSVVCSLTHLSNIVSKNPGFISDRTDSRLLEKSVFQQCRLHSSNSQTQPGPRLPPLCDFPVALWPTFFKTLRNFFFVNMVMRPQFDNEFEMSEFITASKQALQVVSNALAHQDYEQIEDLVTNDVIRDLKQKISSLSEQQKKLIAVDKDDIYMAFPFEVGIMYEGEQGRERRFVEITVVHHILRGLAHMREKGESPPMNMGVLPEYQERIFVCNYRFLREYTKGVDSPWIINMVNHFMPIALEPGDI